MCMYIFLSLHTAWYRKNKGKKKAQWHAVCTVMWEALGTFRCFLT